MNVVVIDYHTRKYVAVVKLDKMPERRQKIDVFGMNYEAVYNDTENGNTVTFAERIENGCVVGLYDYMGDSADD